MITLVIFFVWKIEKNMTGLLVGPGQCPDIQNKPLGKLVKKKYILFSMVQTQAEASDKR